MTTLAEVQKILEEVGQTDDRIGAVFQRGDIDWAIVYDETTIVEIIWDEGSRRLTLSTAIGEPSAERRADVCQALLNYAYLWRDTGGVHAAWSGPEAEMVLLFDWFPADAELQGLAGLCAEFAERGRIWREYITSGSAETPVPEATEPQGIRV